MLSGPSAAASSERTVGHVLLVRERDRGEVGPDLLVLRRGKEDHLRSVDTSAGATDLLVVRDGPRRRAEVDDETEIRLVVSHPEG